MSWGTKSTAKRNPEKQDKGSKWTETDRMQVGLNSIREQIRVYRNELKAELRAFKDEIKTRARGV